MIVKSRLTDENIKKAMGSILIAGVLISGAMVMFGGILYLGEFGNDQPHFKTFRGEPADLRSVKQILIGVMNMQSLSIMQVGLLLLMATPITRVMFSVVGFLLEKDYLYVTISLIVLAIIGYSIFSY